MNRAILAAAFAGVGVAALVIAWLRRPITSQLTVTYKGKTTVGEKKRVRVSGGVALDGELIGSESPGELRYFDGNGNEIKGAGQ